MAEAAAHHDPVPSTMKALVLNKVGDPLQLQTIPTPQATHGSVVIKVICSAADPSLPHILGGHTPFTFPNPLVPGSKCVGRIVQIGPDTTSFGVGQLVMTETFIRARDDPNGVQLLWGMYDGGAPKSKKFMADNWAMGPFAEYVRAPLENVYALDEALLCGAQGTGLGYTPLDLLYIAPLAVPYGGLVSIGLKAGERVVIAPATGHFSGAAIPVALAMGANVVAVGRKLESLQQLQEKFPWAGSRLQVVQTTGDVEADAQALQQWGPVDAYLDISPAVASKSTHVRSCFMSLRQYGRASLMGVIPGDVAVPYITAMFKNLTIRGQYMYEREDVRNMIKMVESGIIKLGKEGGVDIKGVFKLEEADKMMQAATDHTGAGQVVILAP